MELGNIDVVKKKILDAQEMVRDYETFSKQVDNEELSQTFKMFAEESGMQARKLQEILQRIQAN